jgi:hypothetical protein
LESVLPDADDFPSLPAEMAGDAFIAGYVVLTLFIPEGAVGFRAWVAPGAVVPTASAAKRSNVKCQDVPHFSLCSSLSRFTAYFKTHKKLTSWQRSLISCIEKGNRVP